MRAVTAEITHSGGTLITVGDQQQTLAYNIGQTWDGRDIRNGNAAAFAGWRNMGARLELRLAHVLAQLQRSECQRMHLHGF